MSNMCGKKGKRIDVQESPIASNPLCTKPRKRISDAATCVPPARKRPWLPGIVIQVDGIMGVRRIMLDASSSRMESRLRVVALHGDEKVGRVSGECDVLKGQRVR